jgi:peptidoglycan/xylan/chitin deacetylase (PgdA/CDA1 family)
LLGWLLPATLVPPACGAEVRFSDLDLTGANHLVFRARADVPGFGAYDTLLSADLQDSRITQLTFFPEAATLLKDRSVLQIQNRFGVFRSSAGWQEMATIPQFPSFSGGSPVAEGKIHPIQASPDGRYLLFLRQSLIALGNLVLYDLEAEREVVISEALEQSLKGPPAIWSPDSAFLIYSKGGRLYYYSIGQLKAQCVLAEEFRQIGAGRIGNVQWGGAGSLYYVTEDMAYELDSRALFTRALYSGFLKIGTVRGKLPFPFDASFDSFWIAPDGSKILLNKGGRNIFLYILSQEDFLSTGDTLSLPYLYLPRNTRVRKVIWELETITLLTESLAQGRSTTSIYRLSLAGTAMQPPVRIPDGFSGLPGRNTAAAGSASAPGAAGGTPPVFRRMPESGVLDLVLSPEGERIALLLEDRVSLRDPLLWKEAQEILHPRPLHLLWVSEEELIIAGAYWTELYDLDRREARLIAVSQPAEFGWAKEAAAKEGAAPRAGAAPQEGMAPKEGESSKEGVPGKEEASMEGGPLPEGERVALKVRDRVYSRSLAGGAWAKEAQFNVQDPTLASDSHRVYLEDLPQGRYRNLVMVRNLRSLGTTPLFSRPEPDYEEFPREGEPVDLGNFTHGSRIRLREVALVFDVVENIDGLATVLDTLAGYNLRCTFFINGEAVRRFPDAVREIAESGHEVSSLFYAYFDMTDTRFQVDEEFIKRGLARNEDDYHAATGRELSLLWHTPYYFVNSTILSASRAMSYVYVGRDVDPLDWVPRRSSLADSGLYLRSTELVERIVRQKKPGSIIPIQVGVPAGQREDYLFHSLDLLIDSLIKLGYRIVPVSTMIEHAR